MPGWCATSSLPQEIETAVDQLCGSEQAMRAHPTSCPFDSQGNAIHLSADLDGQRGSLVRQYLLHAACRHTIHEKLDGGKLQRSRRCHPITDRRNIERWKDVDVLSLDTQQLTAGRKQVSLGRGFVKPFPQGRSFVDEVLAIVQDKQRPAGTKKCQDTWFRILHLHLQAKHGSNCG